MKLDARTHAAKKPGGTLPNRNSEGQENRDDRTAMAKSLFPNLSDKITLRTRQWNCAGCEPWVMLANC